MHALLRLLRGFVDSPVRTLQLFAAGAVLFFLGLGTVFYLDHSGQQGLRGELLALGAMLLLGAGFLTSIAAQLIFIWQRLKGDP
jgi:hypothetical protein